MDKKELNNPHNIQVGQVDSETEECVCEVNSSEAVECECTLKEEEDN